MTLHIVHYLVLHVDAIIVQQCDCVFRSILVLCCNLSQLHE